MTPGTVAAGTAIVLAVTGLILAHRSRVGSGLYPIRRAMCPKCRKILSLPRRRCPLCGTAFKDELYGKPRDPGHDEASRRERVLRRRSRLCIRLAGIVLVMGILSDRICP